ncbi:MAG: hypothetical protein ABIX01_01760 [Chitinophagaceae bacterium]
MDTLSTADYVVIRQADSTLAMCKKSWLFPLLAILYPTVPTG